MLPGLEFGHSLGYCDCLFLGRYCSQLHTYSDVVCEFEALPTVSPPIICVVPNPWSVGQTVTPKAGHLMSQSERAVHLSRNQQTCLTPTHTHPNPTYLTPIQPQPQPQH